MRPEVQGALYFAEHHKRLAESTYIYRWLPDYRQRRILNAKSRVTRHQAKAQKHRHRAEVYSHAHPRG